jgi:alkylation response protein AidB-like acyl-CoA dehydrogenase
VTQNGLSDSERTLLRRSVRGLLSNKWPADRAVENSSSAHALAELWAAMAKQGLSSLGAHAEEGGLREVLLVFEELGRASAPAPLLGAIAANLAFANESSNTARAFLHDVHAGNATVALALGAFDGDPAAGHVEVHGETLRGRLSFIEGAHTATHLLVFSDRPAGAALVATDAPGLRIDATPGLAVPPFCDVAFEDSPAAWHPISGKSLAEIAVVARLACAGRALGAAERAFELAADHAKVRKQFGQLIGQFQAVQHKLANCLISLDGARLVLEQTAQARDQENPDWTVFAASALAFASPALRAVSIETHRALGAIGYAEEHEAPRHFRRVHADVARFGGVTRARAKLAEFLLGAIE